MSIVILGTADPASQASMTYYDKYVGYFKSALSDKNEHMVVEKAMLEDLLFIVGDGEFTIYDTRARKHLSDYQAVFLRGSGSGEYIDLIGALTEYAEQYNLVLVNHHKIPRNASKLMQAVHFHRLAIPVARTAYVNSALFAFADEFEWVFPCIMKATHGSHGNDNYVVGSLNEAKAIWERDQTKHFVLQRLVPNDGDFRVLVIGEEVLVIGRSAAKGSHLNNTSQGAQATLIAVDTLPDGIIEKSRVVMAACGMTIAGVDVIIDSQTGEYYFLEVNEQPQLMTGAFIEEKKALMSAYLESLLH